jgi:hypothetical protein
MMRTTMARTLAGAILLLACGCGGGGDDVPLCDTEALDCGFPRVSLCESATVVRDTCSDLATDRVVPACGVSGTPERRGPPAGGFNQVSTPGDRADQDELHLQLWY